MWSCWVLHYCVCVAVRTENWHIKSVLISSQACNSAEAFIECKVTNWFYNITLIHIHPVSTHSSISLAALRLGVSPSDQACSGVSPSDQACSGVSPSDQACSGVSPSDQACSGVSPSD